jgi:hypothetical protein
MSRLVADMWFVRLPDNRVIRAKTTKSVRHHLRVGRIPLESYARRSPHESWRRLNRIGEFADLLEPDRAQPAVQVQSNGREDSTDSQMELQLQPVGVRGLAGELASALESTLQRSKLKVAFTTGLFAGLVLLSQVALGAWVDSPWSGRLAAGMVLLLLVVVSLGTVVLTQMTFIELSQLRPARAGEASENLPGYSLRLFLGNLIVMGGCLALLAGLRALPDWIMSWTEPDWLVEARPVLASVAVVLQVLLQLVLWPLLLFAPLLGPIFIVEDCSLVRGLGRWLTMLHSHLARLFLYESLAAGAAFLAALPLLLPVWLAGIQLPAQGAPALAGQATLQLLLGVALAPAFAYLTVANVFIFLHLRYDLSPLR